MISVFKQRLGIVLFSATMLLILAIAALSPGARADGTPTTRTFNVTIERSSNSGHDAKPRGDSAADTWQAAGRVSENGQPAGRVELSTVNQDPRYRASMQIGVLALSDGSVMFQGVGVGKRVPGTQLTATTTTYAVTGGTGTYAGAGGTLVVSAAGKDPAKTTGVLTLK